MNNSHKNVAVINAIFNPDILKIEIAQHSVFDVVLNKTLKLLDKSNIYILYDKEGFEYINKKLKGFNFIEVQGKKVSDTLLSIYNRLKNYDNIIYLFADEPLLDVKITQKLLSLHVEEFSDYTYGEGFIKGVLPEIVSIEILPRLASLDKGNCDIANKDTIFELLSKDINSFDIETIFSDKDLRLMRFELTTSEKRNRMIVEKLFSIKNSFDIEYNEICGLINENPEIVRTVPTYVEVELTGEIRHSLPYLPISGIKRKRGEMKLKDYMSLLESLVKFTDHIYISLSYLGEPLLYPNIRDIIKETLQIDKISLLLETDGLDFTPEFANFIVDLNTDNLTVIFQLDAIKEDTYRKIHGTDIKYVERNIRYLLSKMKKNVYVQMVRMDINEDEMLDFYGIWEKEGAGVIIQKFNDFLGVLPKLSSVDLRPLEDICCYHLMRDMVVFFDGNVPKCKQDINGKYLLGNVFKESIEDVWHKGKSYFKDYCMKNYDEDCKVCDEYYIFNF